MDPYTELLKGKTFSEIIANRFKITIKLTDCKRTVEPGPADIEDKVFFAVFNIMNTIKDINTNRTFEVRDLHYSYLNGTYSDLKEHLNNFVHNHIHSVKEILEIPDDQLPLHIEKEDSFEKDVLAWRMGIC